jgi:hypothetical protein
LRFDSIGVEVHRSLTNDNARAITAFLEYEECLDSPAVIYQDSQGKHHTVSMTAEDITFYTGITNMEDVLGLEGRLLVLKPESKNYDEDSPTFKLYKKIIHEDAEREIHFVGAFDIVQKNHYLRFMTDGNMKADDIIKYAVEYIIESFTKLKEGMSKVQTQDGYTFGYSGIGKKYAYAITQLAYDIAPEIEMYVIDVAGINNSWEIFSKDSDLVYNIIDRLIDSFS